MTQRDLNSLSEEELASLLQNAGKVLDDRQWPGRKEGMEKIKEIAASIGVQVIFGGAEAKPSKRRGGKAPIKYTDPSDPRHKWTGRGMKPKWLRAQIEQGRSLEEFLV